MTGHNICLLSDFKNLEADRLNYYHVALAGDLRAAKMDISYENIMNYY